MKILGVIVLFYPDNFLKRNIGSYIDNLDGLMVWDNTPLAGQKEYSFVHPEKIIRAGEGENKGIGYALDKAVQYALSHDYTYLLTLDQDSYFKQGDFNTYLQEVEELEKKRHAIYSTNYYIMSQQATYYPVCKGIHEVPSCMTSGSIYPVSLFKEIGYFREDLFVWGIDCEFCWRGKCHSIPTVCCDDIVLMHDLGYQRKKRKLFGKEVFPNEYGAARTYYNVRNGIILHKEYPDCIDLKAHLRYHLYKRFVFILLYEKDKLQKLKALMYGYIDGKRGVLGVCPEKL